MGPRLREAEPSGGEQSGTEPPAPIRWEEAAGGSPHRPHFSSARRGQVRARRADSERAAPEGVKGRGRGLSRVIGQLMCGKQKVWGCPPLAHCTGAGCSARHPAPALPPTLPSPSPGHGAALRPPAAEAEEAGGSGGLCAARRGEEGPPRSLVSTPRPGGAMPGGHGRPCPHPQTLRERPRPGQRQRPGGVGRGLGGSSRGVAGGGCRKVWRGSLPAARFVAGNNAPPLPGLRRNGEAARRSPPGPLSRLGAGNGRRAKRPGGAGAGPRKTEGEGGGEERAAETSGQLAPEQPRKDQIGWQMGRGEGGMKTNRVAKGKGTRSPAGSAGARCPVPISRCPAPSPASSARLRPLASREPGLPLLHK